MPGHPEGPNSQAGSAECGDRDGLEAVGWWSGGRSRLVVRQAVKVGALR